MGVCGIYFGWCNLLPLVDFFWRRDKWMVSWQRCDTKAAHITSYLKCGYRGKLCLLLILQHNDIHKRHKFNKNIVYASISDTFSYKTPTCSSHFEHKQTLPIQFFFRPNLWHCSNRQEIDRRNGNMLMSSC